MCIWHRTILGKHIGGAHLKCGRWLFRAPYGSNQTIKLVFVASLAKHATLRRKSKDWLDRNHDNVSEWGDMSIRRLVSVG